MTQEAAQANAKDGRPENGRPHENEKTVSVEVIYNGLARSLDVSKDELIGSVLAKALAAFGNLPAPHTLGLYDAEGRELPDGQSVKDAKVKKGDRLLLRPSTVKAG